MKHAPCLQVCFDEASPAEKRSARFCRSNNFFLLFVFFLPLTLSRWPSHARCLSRGLHFGIGLFVAQHPQGGERQSCLLWQEEPICLSRASHPMHCFSSACPLTFPGEGDSLLPFLFPGAGQSLLPTVFYHTKTLWHSSCDRNRAVGS